MKKYTINNETKKTRNKYGKIIINNKSNNINNQLAYKDKTLHNLLNQNPYLYI